MALPEAWLPDTARSHPQSETAGGVRSRALRSARDRASTRTGLVREPRRSAGFPRGARPRTKRSAGSGRTSSHAPPGAAPLQPALGEIGCLDVPRVHLQDLLEQLERFGRLAERGQGAGQLDARGVKIGM